MIKNFFYKITNRIRVGFLAAFLLLLLAYILTFISTQKVITQGRWIIHTNEIIHTLDNIVGSINKGESLFRGYLITQDVGFIADYDLSIRSTDSSLNMLQGLVKDNKSQIDNLNKLKELITDKYERIKVLVQNYLVAQELTPEMQAAIGRGLERSEIIEQQVNKMQIEERNLWNARSKEVTKYVGLIKIFNVASIIIAILLTLFSFVVFNKENRAKKAASKNAKEFSSQLEKRVEQLADLNKELIELRSLEKYAVTGRIARTIAHEVRNPLTNINLSVDQLQSEVPETPNTLLFFEMITRNSERINQLVSDLLSSTRVADLKLESASINELLERALVRAGDRIELNSIHVIKEFEQDICSVSVDAEKITVAFLNIIVNAIEAMGNNGILTVTSASKNDNCVVKISDNGKGMSKEEVDKLFEPYFTTKEKGNGLGLANAQNIFLGHQGSIFAESEPGVGTAFTITLNFS